MKYDTSGMDVAYVQSQYPNIHRKYIIQTMVHIRTYGYPREKNIISWFNYILMCYIFRFRFDQNGNPIP